MMQTYWRKCMWHGKKHKHKSEPLNARIAALILNVLAELADYA